MKFFKYRVKGAGALVVRGAAPPLVFCFCAAFALAQAGGGTAGDGASSGAGQAAGGDGGGAVQAGAALPAPPAPDASATPALPENEAQADSNLLDKITREGGAADVSGESEEEIDEWLQSFSGPLTTVIYDKETGARHIVYESNSEVIEYYDFAHIKDYDELTYVLMKLLNRIKNDGFRYCSRFSVEYGEFGLPTLVYIRNKNNPDVVVGQLLYPKFRIELSGSKKKDAKHSLDFRNPKMLQNIVFTFVVQILPEIEETVGSDNFNIERFLGVDIEKGTAGGGKSGGNSGNKGENGGVKGGN